MWLLVTLNWWWATFSAWKPTQKKIQMFMISILTLNMKGTLLDPMGLGRGVLLQWRWYTLLIRQMSVGTHITSQPLKCSYEQQFIDNWYNKKHIFGLRPDSWHRASKTFGTSWVVKVIGASFVNHSKPLSTLAEFMLMRWLLMSP